MNFVAAAVPEIGLKKDNNKSDQFAGQINEQANAASPYIHFNL
mgnify:CR=1 FL=1